MLQEGKLVRWLLLFLGDWRVLLTLFTATVILYFMMRKPYRLPPGPMRLPIIGNLHQTYYYSPLYKYCHELASTYGPVIRLNFGLVPCVIINRMDKAIEALVTKQNDFAGRPKSWTAETFSEGYKDIAVGLFNPAWQLQRKLAHSAFRHFASKDVLVQRIHGSFNDVSQVLDKIDEPFDPRSYVYNCVYNIIYAMTYGKSFSIDDPDFTKIISSTNELNEIISGGFAPDYISALKYFPRTTSQKRFMELCDEFIKRGREEYQHHKDTFTRNDIRDLCDDLILAHQDMPEEERDILTETHIVQTLMDIFGAGTDTTSMTLLWTIKFMMAYPEIQKKGQEEIDHVIGQDRLVNFHDKQNLPYCDAILHEVMRHRLPAPIALPHCATIDTTVGGYDVPKDTMVMFNLYGLHHDPAYWTDPEKFDPTRFLDEHGSIRLKMPSFLPFSAGRRVCVGESIAKIDLFVLFACFLQRYSWNEPPGEVTDLEPKISAIGMDTKPFRVVIKNRL
ncbi:PREDICTED: steroid 17-alpha-hydroxylase/17,20 lyase-like [Priapulus caudatus]|uniref:Steroid 17-alpha-hydroxylase/17,20 lyase-like n=1 Tax=Priapulus caudatus TaxID=37621 RepID=A0ABM1ETC3_PRICU|nr:PREDICTED: steroid 17-alpha-hydroxylase/17,20 lyase-like [Priapulus caudatus]